MEAEPEKPQNGTSRGAERIATVIYSLARFIGMTLHVDYEGIERVHELVASGSGGILVTWHGRTLIPANVFRGMGFWALISLSRDGEIQNHIFRRFGYQTIRGSTGRGGAKAALVLARKIREGGILAFTPDGPRGPTHKVQPGTIFLAQRSGRPIIPLGISATPRLFLKTWDSYMIPAPFARAAFVVGEPMYVPSDGDEATISRCTQDLEQAIDACEARAEALVNR